MSQPYIGEIRSFGFPFAPANWAFCNGQSMSIANFNALYAVIGTIYGGDGQTTFNLPNLQGCVPMHWGNPASGFNTVIGQVQGSPSVTLTLGQTPQHTHTITVQAVPSGGIVERTAAPKAGVSYLADSSPGGIYNLPSPPPPSFNSQFATQVLSVASGGNQPHENRQPYLVINFCMSLYGIFPTRG